MTYRTWYHWARSLPWKFKWFILLILSRPFIDLTWHIKLPVLSVSLLQIVGVLTPTIIVFLLLVRQIDIIIIKKSLIDKCFRWWSFLLVLNGFLTWVIGPSLDRLGAALKTTLPVYIFFYLRNFVWSKKNLDGLLKTILYSAYMAFMFFLYEVLFNPFSTQHSRGVERIAGGYADVGNLGFYINISLLISCYFWLAESSIPSRKKANNYQLLFLIGICFICLFRIHHAASYGIFTIIFTLFLKNNLHFKNIGMLLFVFALGFVSYNFIAERVEEQILPIIMSEKVAYEGEDVGYKAFHGRAGRWMRHWDDFRRDLSFPEQMIGLYGVIKHTRIMAGPHNDYLRIIFTSGYIGLTIYIMLLILIFIRSRSLQKPLKFLVVGMLSIIILQSMTLTPTVYTIINYTFMPIILFISLPKSITSENDKT